MLIEVASLVLSPVALAYSRYQEHEADRFGLELTHANHSAAMAFVKMQAENLSNPRPGLFYKIFRATHPEHRRADRFLQRLSPLANDGIRPDGPASPLRLVQSPAATPTETPRSVEGIAGSSVRRIENDVHSCTNASSSGPPYA